MFWHKRSFQDLQLGLLTFCNGEWASGLLNTPVGPVILSIEGDQTAPNQNAISSAHEVMANVVEMVESAMDFVRDQARAREYLQRDDAAFELDGFSFSAIQGKFVVVMGLVGWPDTIFNVQFDTGSPVRMWMND